MMPALPAYNAVVGETPDTCSTAIVSIVESKMPRKSLLFTISTRSWPFERRTSMFFLMVILINTRITVIGCANHTDGGKLRSKGGVLMEIGRIQGCTRVIGRSQGYYGLPLRDIVVDDTVAGPQTPAMETAWLPTPEELAALNSGAPIVLRVFGTAHPPVMIYVGEIPA